MRKKCSYYLFRVIKFLVWLFYPRTKVSGTEHLPDEPAIIVGNHAQMNGPIACELYFPGEHVTWCAGQMMHLKEVPDYAFQDFWSRKPGYIRWLFRLLSYVIAPLSVCVFCNANTIPVYRDTRIITTFRQTIEKLQNGASVIIFPEHNAPYNEILCDFEDKFIDVARFYYKKTGLALAFVPLYVAPRRKEMILGEPIRFDPNAPIAQERERIRTYLLDAITGLATGLPEHVVVPYQNIPKRDYPTNKLQGN